jgi:transposase
MTDAVLSFDVSLDQLDVALRTDDAGWQWPHRAYPNNWPGYQQLKAELLVELGQAAATRLTAVAESTGPYWWPAFYQLAQDVDLAGYQPQLAVLNPQHVKRFRKALPEQDKNDLLDPQLIDRYYQAVGVKHFYQFNDRYLPLRFLSRAYTRIIHTLAAEKAYLRSLLFMLASDYQRLEPFSNLFGATSLHVLDEFDDIQALAAIPLAELTDQLRLWSGNHLSDPAHQAQQLHQVADHSYPLPQALAASLHAIVQRSIAHIRFLSDRFARKRCSVSLNNNCSSCLKPTWPWPNPASDPCWSPVASVRSRIPPASSLASSLTASSSASGLALTAMARPPWPNWPVSGGLKLTPAAFKRRIGTWLGSAILICATGWFRRLSLYSAMTPITPLFIGASFIRSALINTSEP